LRAFVRDGALAFVRRRQVVVDESPSTDECRSSLS
jgi:hypothetical protein